MADLRYGGKSVGFVPTMGALHEGHLSLVRTSLAENDITVLSIFVNPTQFGPQEDLDKYPRQLEQDLAQAEELGVDVVFAPTAHDMYAEDYCTWVEVEKLTEGLCGRYRPGHFRGVTTVVTKLFNIVQPDRAYFGEKDYQQLAVIRRMVRDLNMPIEIRAHPTVREPDGLAMSSRNLLLTPEHRAVAPALYQALRKAAEAVRAGASGKEAEAIVRAELAHVPEFKLQYVEAVDPVSLEPKGDQGGTMVLAAAAFLGDVRLIDNIPIEV
ncbi:MAG: pantoate--beta-alanine ligase [Armatimonadetes bacterium]|nr:pantoate--beta-alanine ligase [Armatimonadota bacterium]